MLEVSESRGITLGVHSRELKALLLDDDAFDRKRIRRFTEKAGLHLEVEEVCSIDEMTRQLDANTFDVIMIDYNLAEENGLQALQIIQSHDANKDAATIMVTGQSQTDIAVTAFRQGCHDFLEKDNLSPTVIHDAFMKAMHQSEMRRRLLNPDPRDVREIFQAAMLDSGMRDMIESAVSDGLRNSIATSSETVSSPQYTDQFLEGFLREDEFVFKN